MDVETQDIGFVRYTKNAEDGTLKAEWIYKNKVPVSGTGVAHGPVGERFDGEYQVTYYRKDGAPLSSFTLVISCAGDYYDLTWYDGDQVKFSGIGVARSDGLYAGWRSCPSEE